METPAVSGQTPENVILLGDVLEILPTFAPRSIDLIIADPPYFSTQKAEVGDVQWPDQDAYLGWLGALLAAFRRVLTPAGSLYLFCGSDLAARTELLVEDSFRVLNTIIWRKPPYSTKAEMFRKEDLRAYFPASERIIFAEQQGQDRMGAGDDGYEAQCELLHRAVFAPLAGYFAAEKARCGISGRRICDGMAARGLPRFMAERHTFSPNQWICPSQESYRALRALFNAHGGGTDFLAREWDALAAEAAALQEVYREKRAALRGLRRPFTLAEDGPYTDVWDVPTVPYRAGKHPCAKPLRLVRPMIRASSRTGALVLDCFAGSGATSQAAVLEGRRYVGIEREPLYVHQAQRALATEMGGAYRAIGTGETDLGAWRTARLARRGHVPLFGQAAGQAAEGMGS